MLKKIKQRAVIPVKIAIFLHVKKLPNPWFVIWVIFSFYTIVQWKSGLHFANTFKNELTTFFLDHLIKPLSAFQTTLIIKVSTMNLIRLLLTEQFDLGPYCLQYMLVKCISR